MAVSAISQEEFQRLQNQLLDLRSANYTLMEESNRYKNELKATTAKYENVEKEFHKAQRALEKSRKAKDVELLFAENDALQSKLMSQEEQFREQNQALLQELANLVATNEKLEAAVKIFQGADIKEPSQTEDFTCQCDIATDHYEKLLSGEKEKFQVLNEEACLNVKVIEQLNLEIADVKKNLTSEVNTLQIQLSNLQLEADKVKHLEKTIGDVKQNKEMLISEISELKRQLEVKEKSYRSSLENLHVHHFTELENLRSAHAEEIKALEIQVELAIAQRAEFDEDAQKARQEAQDAQEDARIAERRIQTVTADLRRQLRVERRRADKLQERLRDFAADSTLPKSETSMDQDNCSVSSWSLMSGQNEGHTATPSSPFPPTDSPSSGSEKNGSRQDVEQIPDLGCENAKLVSRLATIQQEKWRLEERVLHLEETNAAMADEMVKRGKLIQHYCMEGRATPTKSEMNTSMTSSPGAELLSGGMRKMVGLIRQMGHENGGEVDVRRLQRMLEETLTKNMHLQEDVEKLSQEIVRLSQIVGSSNASIVPRMTDTSLMNPA